jgi:hypothetical protein
MFQITKREFNFVEFCLLFKILVVDFDLYIRFEIVGHQKLGYCYVLKFIML